MVQTVSVERWNRKTKWLGALLAGQAFATTAVPVVRDEQFNNSESRKLEQAAIESLESRFIVHVRKTKGPITEWANRTLGLKLASSPPRCSHLTLYDDTIDAPMTDEDLVALPYLRELRIGCDDLTIEGVVRQFSRLKQLQKVTLVNMPNGVELQARILESCPGLQVNLWNDE